MEKEKFVFSFDIKDFDDLQQHMSAIKNVIALTEDGGFLSKLQGEFTKPIYVERKNITINIYKEIEEELPF